MIGLLGNIPWKRFWIARETAPALDWHGYMADPEGKYGKIANPHAKTLEELDDIPCVALLGEPGIGKSYVVDAYRAGVVAREPEGTVVAVDCRWHHDLKEEIFATDWFKGWLAGRSPLTLIVDSLDEHPQGPADVARQLISQISRGPLPSLRLRIACRTAEWPSLLDDQLPRLWNRNGEEPRAVFYALAPLRQADVAQAAGRHAAAFLEQVAQRGAQPLAIKPITLRFLLEEYDMRGALPRTRIELYEEGCKRLCEETSHSREDIGRTGALKSEERLAIASRIAAVCILGRRNLIHRGALRGSVALEAVRFADLVGGTEPSKAGEVAVTAEALDELFKVSGIFAPRGEAYVGWAHQTYAEFLAAWFLRARGLSAEEALRELSSSTMRRAVPALRETAAWLASMDKGAFDLLLVKDPASLLRSDFAMLGHAEREALVGALLREIDRRELFAFSILHHGDLEPRLDHPGLAAQLRPYIVERDHYVMARRTAIEIAIDCKVGALQDALANVMLDPIEVAEIREAAGRAINRLGSRATKLRLKPMITGDCGADPDNSLKGYALEALWPHDLSAVELFASLTSPDDESGGGSYVGFLHGLEQRLTPESLVEALGWTTKLPASHGHQLSHAFASLLEAILTAGWQHIHDERVRPAFAEAVYKRLELYDHIFEHKSHNGDPNPDLEQDDVRRHLLASALMALPPRSKDEAFSYAHNKLILPRDVPWAISQMTAAPSAPQRARWAAVLSRIAAWHWTFDVADVVITALPELKELQEAMPWAFPLHVALGSPESRRMRRDVRQARKMNGKFRHKPTSSSRRKKEKRGASAKRFVRHAMRRFDEGDLELGWRLQHALAFAPTGKSRVGHDEWDLTKFYGWQNADEEMRARILDIARGYLLRSNENERIVEWTEEGRKYYSTAAGYRYLCLIDVLDPNWLDTHADTIWMSWAGVTLVFSTNANKETQRMVGRAYRSQPARVIEVLRTLLVKANSRDGYPFPIFHMAACWNEALGRFLLDFVQQHADLKPRFLGELLDEMIAHDIDGAAAYAASILTAPVLVDGPGRLRAHAAAHALMAYRPEIGWPIMRHIVEADEAFGREVFLTFPRESDIRRSRVWGKGLPDDVAADLYIWIERQFPPDEDPHDRGPGLHAVTPRHMVADLRNTLLNELSSRGTPGAVAAILGIQQAFPHRDFVPYMLSAKEAAAQGTWTPRTPREVIALRPAAAADPGPMTPERLLDALCSLLPSQFQTLTYKLGAPEEHLPGRDAPPATRSADLLRWAEQAGRIQDVERLYRGLAPRAER